MKIFPYCLGFFFLYLFSCTPQTTQLQVYPEIKQIFNDTEIKDLDRILSFFDKAVCKAEGMNAQDVYKCYEQYLTTLANGHEEGKIEIKIPLENQKKLMAQINPNTFKQIWAYGKIYNRNSDTLDIINLKHQSKYALFLESYGAQNKKVKSYHERLHAVGDISPSMIGDVLVNHKKYDISDKRIKLLIAIHYLTLNEQFEVNKKMNALRESQLKE